MTLTQGVLIAFFVWFYLFMVALTLRRKKQ